MGWGVNNPDTSQFDDVANHMRERGVTCARER